jgi:hypothetical protein
MSNKRFYSRRLLLIALVVKGVTGVVGASLILTENHPYISLAVLSLGAGVNEFLLFVEKEKNRIV